MVHQLVFDMTPPEPTQLTTVSQDSAMPEAKRSYRLARVDTSRDSAPKTFHQQAQVPAPQNSGTTKSLAKPTPDSR